MIKECVRIFQDELEENPNIILNEYVPKDGRYLLVEMGDDSWDIVSSLDIKFKKKEDSIEGENDPNYSYIKELDYYSSLIDMNKPMDPKKAVHSSNYFCFSFKSNTLNDKVNNEAIDRFYKVLKDPRIKYKDPKSKELYEEIENKIGPVNQAEVDDIATWLKENLYQLDIDQDSKDYLKIFFVLSDREKSLDLYRREYDRYILVNIFNKNIYNEKLESGEIIGLSNNNLGLNDKKPYLANLGRRSSQPYKITPEEAKAQNLFFDYLMALANKGINRIYFDLDKGKISLANASVRFGYELTMYKEKNEVAIKDFKVITREFDKIDIEIKQYINEIISKEKAIADKQKEAIFNLYSRYSRKDEFFKKLDTVFFEGNIFNRYSSLTNSLNEGKLDIKNSNLKSFVIKYGYMFAGWKSYGDISIKNFQEEFANDLMSVYGENILSLIRKINLYLSVWEYFGVHEGEELMELREKFRDKIIAGKEYKLESEEEFLFALGQMSRYILNESSVGNKNQSFIRGVMSKDSLEGVFNAAMDIYEKYRHLFSANGQSRAIQLVNSISNYYLENIEPREALSNGPAKKRWITYGFTNQCYIYAKNKEEDK